MTSSPTSTLLLAMPSLSPTTMTGDEQALILRVTAPNLRDHVIFSLALGTGLRLAEIVGLDVGDVYGPGGVPKIRVRVRREIAKGGRAADVFLPDRLVAKLKRFWAWKQRRGESLEPNAPLFASQSGKRISKRRVQFAWHTRQRKAGFDRLYGFHALRHGGHERLPGVEGPVPRAEVRPSCVAADDRHVHPPQRRRHAEEPEASQGHGRNRPPARRACHNEPGKCFAEETK